LTLKIFYDLRHIFFRPVTRLAVFIGLFIPIGQATQIFLLGLEGRFLGDLSLLGHWILLVRFVLHLSVIPGMELVKENPDERDCRHEH
jgi:hypothetical protein